MKREGDFETIKKIEHIICKYSQSRCIRDASKGLHFILGDNTPRAVYCRVYEIYVGRYLYTVKLEYDHRDDSGQYTMANTNMELLYATLPGLVEQVASLQLISNRHKAGGKTELVSYGKQ